jgi:hypothetical protein
LAGTLNSRGGPVKVIGGSGVEHKAEDLLKRILPFDRPQKGAQAQIEPRTKIESSRKNLMDSGTMLGHRLDALQFFIENIRWFGHLPPGQRDVWLFQVAVAMSWLDHPVKLKASIRTMARKVGGWSSKVTDSEMGAVFRRCYDAYDGKKIEYEGNLRDPRYRFKDSTIIERLEITDSEQHQILDQFGKPYLCSDKVKAEYNAQRCREKRQKSGSVSRAEFLADSEEKRLKARLLRSEAGGALSIRAIAREMGVGKSQVAEYLK